MGRLISMFNMQNLFNGIYKNKKVLVTGHTGFKGSWLTLWLIQLGAEVTGYALEPETKPALFNILGLRDKIKHISGDIRDFEKLETTIKQYKPEIILHLASQPLVIKSYKDPKYTYETNIMGLINLLEAARETESVKAILNVTSDKCYRNIEQIYGYKESDAMGGFDPYSSSKGCSELVTSAYRNSFNMPLASARAGNVIGGGDWAEYRLVPDCVRSLSSNKQIDLRCPDAVRPWQFVLEPLSGYLLLAGFMCEKGDKYLDSWNFGPDNEEVLKVEDVVNKIIEIWGGGNYHCNNAKTHHEASVLKLDISKAKQYLDWKPVFNTEEAIKATINWYKRYYTGDSDMYAYSLEQLNKYVNNEKFN